MDYQVSARKYRPGTFDDVIGQPHVVQTLMNAIGNKKVAHAYVFSGMRGVGKTTVARILAKALNCEQGPTSQPCEACASCEEITKGNSVDVIEIDGASNTGVDDVRELRENVKFTPFRGGYRVYIIDEVHMLSNSAFNALLKTLEEPPNHAVFVFATTEVHKIPATILSRCQHFTFRRISRLEVIAQLKHVAKETGVTIEDRSLGAIARACDGSMRDALSLLDQAIAFGGDQIRHEDLEALIGTVPDELVRSLVNAILSHDPQTGVAIVGQAVDQGYDVRIFCREIVERMRNLLVAAVVPSHKRAQALLELQQEEIETTMLQAQRVGEGPLQEWFELFSRTENSLRGSLHPRFVFEAAVIKATHLTGSNQQNEPKPSKASPTSAQESVGFPPAAETPQVSPPSQGSARKPGNSNPSVGHIAEKVPRGVRKTTSNTSGVHVARSNDEDVSLTSKVETPKSKGQPEPQTIGALNWELVIDRLVENHPNIGSFLELGTLVNVEPDQVIIGYQKNASVARWRIDKPENRALVSRICEEVAGRPMKVRVVELNDAQTAAPTIGQLRAQRKEKQDQGLLAEARAHPLVKQAMELFGGDLVSARRVPPKEEVS